MKISNIRPIIVNGYAFNQHLLPKTQAGQDYQSGFGYRINKSGSLNTMIISFNISLTVGENEEDSSSVLIPSDDPKYYTIHVQGEEPTEILVSYDSSCQFDFESEGFDADMISLTEFLRDYDTHTKTFLRNYGYKPVLDMEKNLRIHYSINKCGLSAIDNLRLNNMYEF